MIHAVLLLVSVAGVALGALAPDAFYGLMQEDGWAEWATFLAFVAAAVLGIRLWTLSTPHAARAVHRLAAALLIAFTVFVAGEEISWGHRLFAFEPPDIFLEHNYQQELNVHNLLKDILDTRWMVTVIAIVYGAVLPFIVRVDRFAKLSPLAPSRTLAPWFLAVAGLEIFYPFELVGELAELLLGLVFIADIGERCARASPGRRAALVAPGVQVGSLVLSLVLTPIIEVVLYGDQSKNVATVKAELDLLGADLARDGVVRKKLIGKRRVHKRLFTAVRKRYLKLGTQSSFLEGQKTPAEKNGDRRDRKGYFLDVWNQPYWISYVRKDRTVVLYSFGPNRRRDYKGDLANAGDDLAVSIPR